MGDKNPSILERIEALSSVKSAYNTNTAPSEPTPEDYEKLVKERAQSLTPEKLAEAQWRMLLEQYAQMKGPTVDDWVGNARLPQPQPGYTYPGSIMPTTTYPAPSPRPIEGKPVAVVREERERTGWRYWSYENDDAGWMVYLTVFKPGRAVTVPLTSDLWKDPNYDLWSHVLEVAARIDLEQDNADDFQSTSPV